MEQREKSIRVLITSLNDLFAEATRRLATRGYNVEISLSEESGVTKENPKTITVYGHRYEGSDFLIVDYGCIFERAFTTTPEKMEEVIKLRELRGELSLDDTILF